MVTCIIDNGAGKLKAGACVNPTHGDDLLQIKHSNCTARVIKQMNNLVGDQVDECLNGSLLQYNRPFDRGYITNWQIETEVWTRLFGPTGLNISPSESSLCLTDAPFTPELLQNDTNEVVFEDFCFMEYLRKPAAWFSAYQFSITAPVDISNSSSCTIVDSGFSYTHTMPFVDGKCRKSAASKSTLYLHSCERLDLAVLRV